MDHKTISAYNESAPAIAALHATLVPRRLYQMLDQFFIKGATCADIGCGIGRDTHWLSQHGYAVIGIDAAEGMLQQARSRYPASRFINDSLPFLATLPNATFANVLCSAVIMHLPIQQIPLAIMSLLRIMIPDGVIILSLRGTQADDCRENGKLYTPITPTEISTIFTTHATRLLYQETDYEKGRSFAWHNLIFKKQHHPAA